MRGPCSLLVLVVPCLAVPAPLFAQQPSAQALELRNLGIAQLENERPGEAEATFRRLLQIEAEDPLPLADLAIALLRQQKGDEALELIELALRKAPERGDLQAIKGEILAWTGEPEAALQVLEEAARLAPRDPEILYALYRHATTLRDEEATVAAASALHQLAELRPENLVVLAKLGQLSLDEGDRTLASQTFLRIRELLWQAQPIAVTTLQQILDALESGDLEAAKVPAIRLENVLKITPMYKSSLVELFNNVQGRPVARFEREPEPTSFGDPVPVRFVPAIRATGVGVGTGLVTADLDGDGTLDSARLETSEGGQALVVRLTSKTTPTRTSAPPVVELLLLDLDNDGHLDLLGYGGSPPASLAFWRNDGDGTFQDRTAELGLAGVTATAVAAIDFDSEGDLDLAVALPGDQVVDLFRNSLEGPLERVGPQAMPHLVPRHVNQLLARDLDRDGDTDLLLVHENGLTWLDNLRQGRFQNRSAIGGLRDIDATQAVASGDLDNDGYPELALLPSSGGIMLLQNLGGVFQQASTSGLPDGETFVSLVTLDADNDGRLDLAAASARRTVVLQNRGGFHFEPVAPISMDQTGESALGPALAAGDLDGDGDVDLLTSGVSGLVALDNSGGNANHWLNVELRGLTQGNNKNNAYGYGASLEVRLAAAYQYREVTEPVTHFGLGKNERADSLRVVWANGVPQHRIHPEVDQRIVEEQVLKGSCPFLYTWNGEEITFVTDLLWGAPIGMPVAPGVWAGADPQELVRVDGAVSRDGVYDLRVTEELWEAAFFDFVRLWVVDHPREVEVASNLRIVPGTVLPDGVLATRDVRPVAAAWDGRGREVTDRLRQRDEVYADGYPVGDYQGLAPEPWSLTFDLGVAPASPVRLLLDGWVFPADASLNLAIAQRDDLPGELTRLEVLTDQGWQVLLDPMGFFAGKTKTLVIDTPPLPAGASMLRITTTRWLSYDRLAWSTTPADAEAQVVAKLSPKSAELRYRGFSRLLRPAPNGPHVFDYSDVRVDLPWLPLAGHYTRYGDVRELLLEPDDRLVVLAAGDDLELLFDAETLPPPEAGYVRALFLESHGWDKDADRNTWQDQQVEPLPFRAMTGYPYAPGETYPDSQLLREYREHWLTRRIAPASHRAGASAPSP